MVDRIVRVRWYSPQCHHLLRSITPSILNVGASAMLSSEHGPFAAFLKTVIEALPTLRTPRRVVHLRRHRLDSLSNLFFLFQKDGW